MSQNDAQTAYREYDERLQRSRLMPLLREMAEDDRDGNITAGDLSDRLTLEEANAFAKDRSNVTLSYADSVTKRMQEFGRNTTTLGQMNESYNANKYIKNMLDAEHARVRQLHQEARREVYTAQQRHMSTHHRAHHNYFLARVFAYTLLATMILAVVVAAWMQDGIDFVTFFGLTVAGLVVYAVLLALLFSANTRRRQVHWKQYYWGAPAEAARDECKRQ